MNKVNNSFILDFNNCVNEFLDNLKKLVNDILFNKFYKKIKQLLKSNINTEILIKKYIITILPYNKLIQTKDSKLFSEIINNEKDNIIILIQKINNIWNNISEKDKNNIFDYLLVLSFHATEYYKIIMKTL